MVKIRELINTSILNSEWVGFNGDSEFIDENGELQMGSWTFLEMSSKQEVHYGLNAEISNDKIFNNPCIIWVQNDKGHSCKIQLNYKTVMESYTATITYKDGTTETITIMAEDLENADFIIGTMVAFNPNFQDYEVDLTN